MKKIIILLIWLLLIFPLYAITPTNESRLFIHPFREVFINLPSETLGVGVRLTIFLPDEKIPLTHSYPLAVCLGAPSNQLAAGEQIARHYRLIVAVVSWEDWAEQTVHNPKLVENFLHRELIPYLETNYAVLPGGENRMFVSMGVEGAQSILPLLKHTDWLGKIALLSPGKFDLLPNIQLQNIRFFIRGTQYELAHAQQTLEKAGLSYGTGFAMRYAQEGVSLLESVDWNYMVAESSQVQLKRLEADTQKTALSLHGADQTGLRIWAQLKNGAWFDFIPPVLRFSPPYLNWEPEMGLVQVVHGAATGPVKVKSAVDNQPFSLKIKLKP